MNVEIADLDCIYLSYDEPQKEEFWVKIKNMVPWARRVDGVKGSDAAHKAAAKESFTERFIIIDGDNLPDLNFFNLILDFTDKDESYQSAQFRWKARNIINGLTYGNGGISCWTKDYVFNMRTHEASDGSTTTTVDFCLDYLNSSYWSMHDCYSTTYPNYTPFQAWRAGFREGVKMCLVNGVKPSIEKFKQSVATRNLDNLTIWHNIGTDVENGEYAIYGSQYGTYMTMLTNWDYNNVHWFDNYPEIYEDFIANKYNDKFLNEMSEGLTRKLGLPISVFKPEQSKFFKRHYNTSRQNLGPLVKEMDVIRKLEGW